MHESPATIARDLSAEIGLLNAIRYLAGEIAAARTWRERWRGFRLLVAVVV